MKKKSTRIIILILVMLAGGGTVNKEFVGSLFDIIMEETIETNITVDEVPGYSNNLYAVINDNIPFFEDYENKKVFEKYASLDYLGRAVQGYALIGEELMPEHERTDISSVIPTGYQVAIYEEISGKYLYHRSHLIGFQLAGENANEKNLITGTQSMNVEGMLPFENLVAGYVKETGNHVLYRVTAIYKDDDFVASGVLMEAMSYEDKGEALQFCVYVYNNQPGIEIDYSSGDSRLIK